MPTYGGDEVSAIVLDMGSNTIRAGYAGEDTPKVVMPTSYGFIQERQEDLSTAKYFFGDHGPNVWRAGMKVMNPLRDSIVQDWNVTEKMLNVVFDREMRLGLPGADLEPNEKRGILTEHPLLVTEASWNSKENRERMIEMAFEQFDTPAYYSVDRAVMCAFASGKGTALVVDIGEELTTVTPVSDGFVLRKGIQKSPLAGKFLSSLLLSSVEKQLSNPIYPHYLIASKPHKAPTTSNPINEDNDTVMAPVEESIPEGVVLRDDRMPERDGSSTTKSFSEYQKMSVIQDLKETVCEAFPRNWDEDTINMIPPRSFEFPTGQILKFGKSRYSSTEALFDPTFIPNDILTTYPASKNPSSTIPIDELSSTVSLPKLIMRSVKSCDVDVQANLNLNIIITGGSSLVPGLVERLDWELRMMTPGMKFKISATGNLMERRFASWLGGSILASLGSFHQLWIGKDEYKEQGRTVVHRRCK
ncbi:actin family [Phakopsora pachyrhizi]|uniref:Actin family n=1 Tax=Phakopsora pachyrhizi TaxID=170000 RepID=A0AAV0BTK9_PHAPC|nr:actin family [Phakopsora pachyrhizi]CAH7689432.1 actin family [Phakopsora pachyrhizi]